VWILVDLPIGKRVIRTKWVFRNKKDERGIVIRNKARIEAIRLFLAYASFMGFLVYQMDVKSAFLYGTIEEEFYVTQPPGFKDPDHPDKVYKVVKALYGLHQAPRAWYETLANYLLGNRFKRRKIDQTLFIKKQKGDIFLVQVYVDDIIFGSTNKDLCTGFEKLMKDKFQMSSMGELTFFIGLQVQQKEDGIFISQDKYVDEILKKFNYTDVKSASTPVDLEKPLVKDGDVDDVDVHLYRSMIGSLMYLIASRPDIMFAVCACARFQVTLKTSHLLAVKRIFRYLKGKLTLGLWYSRDSPFELVAYTDSDYAGATQDRKSITRGCQILGNRLISWQCKKQTVVATSTTIAEYVAAASCCRQVKNDIGTISNSFKFLSLEERTPRIPHSSGPPDKVGCMRLVHKEMGEDSDHPTDFIPIPIINQPSSSSQPKKDKPSKRIKAANPKDKLLYAAPTTNLQDPRIKGWLYRSQGKDQIALDEQIVRDIQAKLEVIVNGDAPVAIASASAGTEGPIPPKTAEQKLARKNELKAKSTMFPETHLPKYNSSSNNETVNTDHSVSVASSKDQASIASYTDDVMFSFFSNQSNALQLDYEDLEQIDADDLEEMDFKWQVAMLTIRVKRFIKKTGRKMDLNNKETVGFYRTKVECYNCYRRGYFARECRAPRNQGNRNRDALRRNAPVDTSTTNALVVQDGIGGYDWSFQAEEGITNFALMAYTSQGYQMGLESLEAKIVVHEKNEVVYEEDIAFLKYDVQGKDISIKDLKN
ncbi:putative ribonuclease H-like domain-containing protein, partial [Tanacetum coccineum]